MVIYQNVVVWNQKYQNHRLKDFAMQEISLCRKFRYDSENFAMIEKFRYDSEISLA